jgi:hypothetical protein
VTPLPHFEAQSPATQLALAQSAPTRHLMPSAQPVGVGFGVVQFELHVPHAEVLLSSQASVPSIQPLPQAEVHTLLPVVLKGKATQLLLAQSPLTLQPVPPAHSGPLIVAVQVELQVPHCAVLPSSHTSPGSVGSASPQ